MCSGIGTKLLGKPGSNTRYSEGVSVGCSQQEEGAHASTSGRIARQQGFRWIYVFEPFQNGKALGQGKGSCSFEGWHRSRRVDCSEMVCVLIALSQIMHLLFKGDTLQQERCPDTICRKGKPVTV